MSRKILKPKDSICKMLHVHLKCFSIYLRLIKPQEFASHLSQPRLLPEVATGVSYKKDVLKYFAKLIGKHLCQSLFFNNVAGLRPATLLNRDSGTGVFLWILRNFYEHLFIENLRATASILPRISKTLHNLTLTSNMFICIWHTLNFKNLIVPETHMLSLSKNSSTL